MGDFPLSRDSYFQRYVNRNFKPNPLSKRQTLKRMSELANKIKDMSDDEQEAFLKEKPEFKELVESINKLSGR
jgi:hypothetical protein